MPNIINMCLKKLTCLTFCIVPLLLFYLCCLQNVDAFNLDILDYVQYTGDNNSMFGFSVAAHKSREYNWVLIGAPQANSFQPGVYNGGAVYYCPTDRDEGCRLLNFDRSGNNKNSTGIQIDEKSGQWFGATVQSGGPDKPIVACAPRYLWFTQKNGRRDPVGTCYVSSSDFRDVLEFSPCRTRHWGYHRQGMCQAGLGAAVSKNGDRLFIGAPGSWYWQGQMYSIDPSAKLPFTPHRFSNYGTSAGQVYSQDIRKRPAALFTKEGQPLDDDSYLGYSVTSGNFTGDKDAGIAAGMPRGSRLVGKVLLYTWNLTNYRNISGLQLGAYFGYSVAAADVNGDGRDDLIVGAPLHTEPNNGENYEMGRVYVFDPIRRRNDTIDGDSSKGRFGLSVTSLGDLDLDGYHDIAVGAPYAGPDGRGAVYIYYGSKKGIRTKVSQIIYAENVSQTAMYTFGFSVSGSGIDLDNNYYPDLVVGAYASSKAFILRAQPVINVNASITFNTENGVIGLDEKNCTIAPNRRVVCTAFRACVEYYGIGVNDKISLIMEFVLDAKKTKDPRMYSHPSDRRQKFNETWILRKNDLQCKIIQVYIRDSTRDKLTPMEVQMRYYLYNEQTASSHGASSASLIHHRNPHSVLQAVLNGNSPSVYKDSINIRKNCGSDDVCIPDLRLHVKSNVDKYLLGSGKKLELNVIVKNEGEDSFESMFYMQLPPGINYFNTEKLIGSMDIPVKCSPPSEYTNNTLKCDIGNPLPQNKLVHFKVMLEPFNIEGMSPSYDFTMFVNSTNKENAQTTSDNLQALTIDIWVKTNLSLTGWAHSPDIHYKENQYKEDNLTIETEIGPQVVHIYSIKNNGPSDIIEADVLFLYPSHTLAGDDLLYLMEQPETSGSIRCEHVQHVNLPKVELLTKKYLDSSDGRHAAGHIAFEDKVTTNVAGSHSSSGTSGGSSSGTSTSTSTSSGSSSSSGFSYSGGSRIHYNESTDDKIDDTGDASYIHVNRGKERTSSSSSSTSTSGASSGGSYSSQSGHSSSSGSIRGGGSSSSSGGGGIYTEYRGGESGGIITGSRSGGGSGGIITENRSGIITESGGSRSGGTFTDTRSGGSGTASNEFITGSRSGGTGAATISGSYSGSSTHTTKNTTTTYTRNPDGTITKHTRITTTNTDGDGLHGSGSGSRGGTTNTQENRQIIHYTSTGGNSNANNFGISQQENQDIHYGTVHHSQSQSQTPSTSYRHNQYFNWNNNQNQNNTHNYGYGRNQGGLESSDNRGFIISTEESVNEGLDEYTRTVTLGHGLGHGHGQISLDGNEFRTGAFDLGQMDYEKNNVGYHSASGGTSGASSTSGASGTSSTGQRTHVYYDPDLGSYEERTDAETGSHGHRTVVTYGGHSRAYNTAGARHQHHQTVGDNVPTEHPADIDYRNRIYRNKRRVPVDDDISDIVECKSTKCSMIRCKAGRLSKDEEAWSALRFRANATTLKKLGWTESVTVSSMMVSRINKLPYIGTPNDRPIHTHEVFTNMTYTEAEIKPDVVPLWVVVLSACAGAIILLLLVFLLYKCGFFKRNRPTDVPERQPLNRNGHYQGDEQL